MVSNKVVQELAITAELCGANLSPAAAKILVSELGTEKEVDLLAGLKAMRREHSGRFSLADVLEYTKEAKRQRIARTRTCVWCVLPATHGDMCEKHAQDEKRIKQERAAALLYRENQ